MFERFPSAYLFERKRLLNRDLNFLTFFQPYTQKASPPHPKIYTLIVLIVEE